MPDLLEVIGPRAGSAPLAVELTQEGLVDLMSVFAHFDGAGASGSWRPVLTIRSQNGTILSRTFPNETVLAGGSADVTFAPFLRTGGSSSAPGGLAKGIKVYNTALQSIPNATWTKLVYTTTYFAYNASFSIGTPASITVDQAGVYIVRASCIFAPNANGVRYITIGKNGVNGGVTAQLPFGNDYAGVTNFSVQVMDAALLAAGDTVEAWVYQNSGGPLNANASAPNEGASLTVVGWFFT